MTDFIFLVLGGEERGETKTRVLFCRDYPAPSTQLFDMAPFSLASTRSQNRKQT